MNRDPKKRLGSINDAEELKQHIFFKGIKWDQVYRKYSKVYRNR